MSSLPFVSVIFPVRNESTYIRSSLGAALAQDYPVEYMEILIVDGMSTDNMREIITELADQHPQVNLHILENPGKIVPTGMNIAIFQARGDIIVRVDGHTIIAPNYVRQCVDTLQRTQADNVGGKMNAVGSHLFGKVVALATSTPFGIGGARFHYSDEEEWVDTVYLGAWPRQVFEKIGLFDEELVRDQDDEFNYRLLEQGGRIFLSPSIYSEYTVRSTPQSLCCQYYQYGFWKVRILQKHSHQMRLRQFVPPSLALALLLSLLFMALFPLGWVAFTLVVAGYTLANLVASIIAAVKKGGQQLFLLPLTFAIVHFSYGFGFLAGLIKFWNRWGDKKGRVPEFQLNEK